MDPNDSNNNTTEVSELVTQLLSHTCSNCGNCEDDKDLSGYSTETLIEARQQLFHDFAIELGIAALEVSEVVAGNFMINVFGNMPVFMLKDAIDLVDSELDSREESLDDSFVEYPEGMEVPDQSKVN